MKKDRITLIIIIALQTLFLFVCLYEYFNVYHIKLNGKKYEVVNYDSEYVDKGVNVKYRGKDYKDVKVINNVNTSKLGKYLILYTAGNNINKRIVEVVDMEEPKITLNGSDTEVNIYEKYKEPGYRAIDNYDGNISDKVMIESNVDINKLGSYYVKYSVKDMSNNRTEVVRKVNVVDKEKPVIKFNNSDYAIVGSNYNIKDFKAIDNYDGDITDKVVVKTNFDINKEGIYDVHYSVMDSNNNVTMITRKINVQEKNTSGIPVLMYHWFYDDTIGEESGKVNAHNYIAKTEVEKQVRFLKEEGYYFPTWQELIDYIDGKIDLPKKSVIATDDDCEESFFRVALPVFQKYEVPVTSFCITRKNTYQKYMNEPFLDMESHTEDLHTRKCDTTWDGAVMCTPYDKIYEDIKISVSKVKNTWSFAYPFGHYNDNTIKALKENDIKLAFTIANGRVKRNANKYKLPRVRISSWTTIDDYRNALK